MMHKHVVFNMLDVEKFAGCNAQEMLVSIPKCTKVLRRAICQGQRMQLYLQTCDKQGTH